MMQGTVAHVHRNAAVRSAQLLALTGLAATMRVAVSGGSPQTSLLAALVFSTMLLATAHAGGLRLSRPGWRAVPVTAVGTAVLLWFPLQKMGFPLGTATHASAGLLLWSVVVCAVAITEECVFRGALFSTVGEWLGVSGAVAVCAVMFALIHVPLYGWHALPLDLAVGIWLGAVRLWGGVGAAAATHTLADLAAGWLLI
jgi:membrane protease YdiL (CAAX protease family)